MILLFVILEEFRKESIYHAIRKYVPNTESQNLLIIEPKRHASGRMARSYSRPRMAFVQQKFESIG